MSEKGQRRFTVRLDEETLSKLEKEIKIIIESEELLGQSARSNAFKKIINRKLLGFQEKEIPGAIPNLEQRVNCSYLRKDYIRNAWVCDDTVAGSKRANTVLGDLGKHDENVLAVCLAHLRKLKEIQDQKIREILAKQTVAKAVEFYKKFMTIAEDGFGAGCLICTAMLVKESTFRISGDNKTLECHKLGKHVDINTVCRENINLSTKAPPCEFFVEFVHSVYFDDIEEFKEVDAEIGPTECSAYGTPECPGAHQCTEDLNALAKTNKYCPERSSPAMGVSLLEEQEEPHTGVPLLEDQEEPTE